MSSLRFEPVNPKHSIEDFFLGIRFARQLTEATFTKTIIEARGLAALHNLPAENQQANFLLAVDPVSGMHARPASAYGTYFQRFNSVGGVEEEIRLERNFVGYRTGKYDRWKSIVEKLEAIVLPLAQQYAVEASLLDSVVLQYVDRFTSAEPGNVDWSELFNPTTPWIASGMLSTATAWHSHSGRFEKAAEASSARRLINVNVDVGEPVIRPGANSFQSLAILTLCTDQFVRPSIAAHVIDPGTFQSDMRSRFELLHQRAKAILQEVLSDAYLDRIDLTKSETQR